MKVLISGVCGFAGSHLARYLVESHEGITIVGVDNLARSGSETNRVSLKRLGVQLFHGDIRMASDLETLPVADWVIDAAAQPSVLAGRDGKTSTRQLLEHNLLGTINLLEYCRASRAGLILLSTSRVYSIPTLTQLPLRAESLAYTLDGGQPWPAAVSSAGVAEGFSTEAPISLYGATKLASERLAQEYAAGFQVPVWINRCGVLAGAGQFGTAEQGIFSYWLHAHATRRSLKYIGFGGRDSRSGTRSIRTTWRAWWISSCARRTWPAPQRVRWPANSMSLAQLTAWCDQRFGPHQPMSDDSQRPYDVPWLILDSGKALDGNRVGAPHQLPQILEEIADHAATHPDWLTWCGA